MARQLRNLSFVLFLVSAVYSSTAPLAAITEEECGDLFTQACQVSLASVGYTYQCTTGYSCSEINDCCEFFCAPSGIRADCFDSGSLRFGFCECTS